MVLARNLFAVFLLISISSVFAAENFPLKSEIVAGLPRTPSLTPPPLPPMSPPPPRSPMSPAPDSKATYSPGEAQLRLELAAAENDLLKAELASARARIKITTVMNALQRKYSASHTNESRDATFHVDGRLLHVPASPPPGTDPNEESKKQQQERIVAFLSPGAQRVRQAQFEAFMNQAFHSREKAAKILS